MNELTITQRAGRGPFHFVCVPGLVPDGPETFLRQEALLRRFGSTATITYPYVGFDLEAVLKRLREEIDTAHLAKRLPILMGVSVGGGLVLELIRRERDAGRPLPLAGVILISPLSCAGDLSPLLKRLMDGIVAEELRDNGDPEAAVERGRTFFKSLASKSAAPRPKESGLKSLFALLTPQGINDLAERRIRARIEKTLEAIPSRGGIARTMALRHLGGIGKGPLTHAPTLLLWGSKERHTLDMDGPGARVLCRPDLAVRSFPNCEVHWVYGGDGDEVPHASLLKHARSFNRLINGYLGRRWRSYQAERPLFQRSKSLVPFMRIG